MSYDPSKIMYVCDRCNSYPCSCRFTHKPLEIMDIKCNDCDFVSLGMVEMSNHHLDEHEIGLILDNRETNAFNT